MFSAQISFWLIGTQTKNNDEKKTSQKSPRKTSDGRVLDIVMCTHSQKEEEEPNLGKIHKIITSQAVGTDLNKDSKNKHI